MNQFFVRRKSQMAIIRRNKITPEKLFSIFIKEPTQTVYVIEEDTDGLIGIITLGDFRRNRLGRGKKLVNINFTSVSACNEQAVLSIFEKRPKIISIPIIDDNGEIVKEYCRQNSTDIRRLPFEIVKDIAKSLCWVGSEYKKIIFLVPGLSDDEKIILSGIFKYYLEKILYMETITKTELMELNRQFGEELFLCDMCIDYGKVREILYEKYNINYFLWDIEKREDEIKTIFKERAVYYTDVAVLENSFVLDGIKKNTVSFFQTDEITWNAERDCYEINTLNSKTECILMLCCFQRKPYVFNGEKYLPIISLKYCRVGIEEWEWRKNLGVNIGFPEKEAVCFDIASNIIPKLEGNGIQCVIINDLDREYPEIKKYIKSDIVQREPIFEGNMTEDKIAFLGNKKLTEELKKICLITKQGFFQTADMQGEYVNFKNGERYTEGNPLQFQNTVYLFGPCTVRGNFVDDEHTLGSYLRKWIPDNYYIKNLGSDWFTMNYMMRKTQYKRGDIVILFAYDTVPYRVNKLKSHTIKEIFVNELELQENIWDAPMHCNGNGNKYVANAIYDILRRESSFSTASDFSEIALKSNDTVSFGVQDKEGQETMQMTEWLKKVSKYKVRGKCQGAIVMNCNPFTLGHKYLIEEARKQVDTLYVFVVEEDKSYFKFKDRIEMVRLGTQEFENVVVVPGGRYIISTETLPGYFEKEKNPYAEFDATEDLEFFGKHIAAFFEISIRFAGEEPKDLFTAKYNESMKRILPEYGIKFCEIERKMIGNQPISASLVRLYLKEKKYDAMRALLPQSTYDYLVKKYMV